MKGLKAIVLIFSNGSSLEELKEKSSIYENEEERLGMHLNAHEGTGYLFLSRSIVYPNVILF